VYAIPANTAGSHAFFSRLESRATARNGRVEKRSSNVDKAQSGGTRQQRREKMSRDERSPRRNQGLGDENSQQITAGK